MKLSVDSATELNGRHAMHHMLVVLCLLALSWPPHRTLAASEAATAAPQTSNQVSKITATRTSPVQAASSATTTTTTTTASAAAATTSAIVGKNQAIKQQHQRANEQQQQQECQYEKSPWSECQPNGEQTRTLKLISNERSSSEPLSARGTTSNNDNNNNNIGNNNNNNNSKSSKCPKVRLVRRECKQGCKYSRGDWSPDCVNGQRVRIDTLVGHIDSPASSSKQPGGIKCEPQRKVTKDCRRACHYVKSAWSECVNGFKTRDLRLEELPSTSVPSLSSCAKHRQIKRECNSRNHEAISRHSSSSSTQPPTSSPTSQQQQQPKLTQAQKRRLKQLHRQQKQQQQQLSNNNNNNNKSI